MSDADDESIARLVADLARSLRDLQRELDDGRGPRPPTPGTLLRFADEVAIPGLILLLETNVRALRLLQRAIRIADGRERPARDQGTAARDRATQLSRTTLDGLDAALAEVQAALEGRPPDDEARQLLEEARRLRAELDERLDAADPDETSDPGRSDVPVDVDSELQSIRDDLDDGTDEE